MFVYRERPAAIPIEIKSIDDTSNFDEFPESDILQPGEASIYSMPEYSLGSFILVNVHFSDTLIKLIYRLDLDIFFQKYMLTYDVS